MANDYVFHPGDGTNNLLRKILDRLNAGLTFYGTQGELPIDVPIIAVANIPAFPWHIYGEVAVTNFPGDVAVNNFPGGFNVNNFPAIQPVVVTGNPDVHLSDPQTNNQAHISNFRQLHVESQVRLIGQSFNTGNTLDPSFWSTALTGSGAVSVSVGQVRVQTGATANSTASLVSSRTARHIGSTQNIYRTVVRLSNTGSADNVRRWGAFTASDGFFFQLNGSTLQVGHRYGGLETTVNQGAWSHSNTFTVDTNWHAYEIHYSISKAFFYIDSVLVHVFDMLGGLTPLAATQNYPVRFDNYNTNGGTASVSIYATHALISRLGVQHSGAKYINIAAAATTVLKLAAGVLHRIVIGNPAGSVTVYDNTTNAAPIMFTFDLTGVASSAVLELDADFNTGLTIVTSSASVNLTAIYE